MGFKETFKESPYESFGIVLGLIGFFVTFFYLLDTSDAATILIVSNIVTFLIVISSILLISFAQIIRQTRTVGIEYIASPDEVWDKSIAVLDEVIFTSDLTTNKQCYDVTSIPNWINYEQKVAECLNRGQSFDRIFCYSADSDNPNHRALEWFHNKI